MKDIAFSRIRYGYRRIWTMLRREGFTDNHKRVYRIYRQEGLNLRTKRPRRNRSAAQRQERIELTGMHQVWSMDFVADQLFNGKRFRILTIVDNYSKKSPGLYANQNIKGIDVVGFLDHLVRLEGSVPKRLQVDIGSSSSSRRILIARLMSIRSRWTFQGRANQQITPILNHSMASFVMNACQ